MSLMNIQKTLKMKMGNRQIKTKMKKMQKLGNCLENRKTNFYRKEHAENKSKNFYIQCINGIMKNKFGKILKNPQLIIIFVEDQMIIVADSFAKHVQTKLKRNKRKKIIKGNIWAKGKMQKKQKKKLCNCLEKRETNIFLKEFVGKKSNNMQILCIIGIIKNKSGRISKNPQLIIIFVEDWIKQVADIFAKNVQTKLKRNKMI